MDDRNQHIEDTYHMKRKCDFDQVAPKRHKIYLLDTDRNGSLYTEDKEEPLYIIKTKLHDDGKTYRYLYRKDGKTDKLIGIKKLEEAVTSLATSGKTDQFIDNKEPKEAETYIAASEITNKPIGIKDLKETETSFAPSDISNKNHLYENWLKNLLINEEDLKRSREQSRTVEFKKHLNEDTSIHSNRDLPSSNENQKDSSDLGWTQKFGYRKRGASKGQIYIYYMSPQGKKLTSKHALRNYCLFNNVDGGDLNQYVFNGKKAAKLIEQHQKSLEIEKQSCENDNGNNLHENHSNGYQIIMEEKVWPRPPCKIYCLCVLALKNSSSGVLYASEIGDFLKRHFPFYRKCDRYLKTAIATALSSYRKYFRKSIIVDGNNAGSKKKLWHLNTSKILLEKLQMEIEALKMMNIKESMEVPGNLYLLETGHLKFESIFTGKINVNSSRRSMGDHNIKNKQNIKENSLYPLPQCSPAILIALAIKNSPSQNIFVSQIFKFICEQFPSYNTINSEWKDSIWKILRDKKDRYFLRSTIEESGKRLSTWCINPSTEKELEFFFSKTLTKNHENLKLAMKSPELLHSSFYLQLESNEFVDADINAASEIDVSIVPGYLVECTSINDSLETFSKEFSRLKAEPIFELDDGMSPAVKLACKAILNDSEKESNCFIKGNKIQDNNECNSISNDSQPLSPTNSTDESKINSVTTLEYNEDVQQKHLRESYGTSEGLIDSSQNKLKEENNNLLECENNILKSQSSTLPDIETYNDFKEFTTIFECKEEDVCGKNGLIIKQTDIFQHKNSSSLNNTDMLSNESPLKVTSDIDGLLLRELPLLSDLPIEEVYLSENSISNIERPVNPENVTESAKYENAKPNFHNKDLNVTGIVCESKIDNETEDKYVSNNKKVSVESSPLLSPIHTENEVLVTLPQSSPMSIDNMEYACNYTLCEIKCKNHDELLDHMANKHLYPKEFRGSFYNNDENHNESIRNPLEDVSKVELQKNQHSPMEIYIIEDETDPIMKSPYKTINKKCDPLAEESLNVKTIEDKILSITEYCTISQEAFDGNQIKDPENNENNIDPYTSCEKQFDKSVINSSSEKIEHIQIQPHYSYNQLRQRLTDNCNKEINLDQNDASAYGLRTNSVGTPELDYLNGQNAIDSSVMPSSISAISSYVSSYPGNLYSKDFYGVSNFNGNSMDGASPEPEVIRTMSPSSTYHRIPNGPFEQQPRTHVPFLPYGHSAPVQDSNLRSVYPRVSPEPGVNETTSPPTYHKITNGLSEQQHGGHVPFLPYGQSAHVPQSNSKTTYSRVSPEPGVNRTESPPTYHSIPNGLLEQQRRGHVPCLPYGQPTHVPPSNSNDANPDPSYICKQVHYGPPIMSSNYPNYLPSTSSLQPQQNSYNPAYHWNPAIASYYANSENHHYYHRSRINYMNQYAQVPFKRQYNLNN